MSRSLLLNRQEASEALRVSIRSLDHFTKTGAIAHVRIGTGKGRVLFRPQDLDAFVSAHHRPALEGASHE